MEARGAGPVTEWVVEEDARRILLSPPPGAVCERSISSCCVWATARGRAPGTESPLLSLPVRMRAGDDVRRDDGTTARGRERAGGEGKHTPAPGLVPSPECVFSAPLSLPVRDASRGRRGRYHEGTTGTKKPGVL